MTDESGEKAGSRQFSRSIVSLAVQMRVSLRGVDDEPGSFDANGETINVSRGGMLARIDRLLPVDRRCVVQFPDGGEKLAPTAIRGVVVRCDPVDEGIAVAIEFETPLEFLRRP